MTGTIPCRSCRGPKPPGKYLCLNCWSLLTNAARAALTRRDRLSLARLRELHTQIDGGRALAEIRVTP